MLKITRFQPNGTYLTVGFIFFINFNGFFKDVTCYLFQMIINYYYY